MLAAIQGLQHQVSVGTDFYGYTGSQWLSFTSGGASSTINGSGSAGQLTYWNGTNSITGTSSLFWDQANGRLGIGTSTPQAPLHLVQSVNDWTGAMFENTMNNASSAVMIGLTVDDVGGALMLPSSNFSQDGYTNMAGYLTLATFQMARGIALAAVGDNNNIIFYVGGNEGPTTTSERMRIESNGFVGIGTNVPMSQLHVVQNTDTFSPTMALENQNNGTSSISGLMMRTASSSGGLLLASTNFTQDGLTNLAGYMALVSMDQTKGLALAANGDPGSNIVFYINGNGPPSTSSEKMRIEETGRVAIGTPNTYEMLTVNGGIHIGASTTPTSTAGDIIYNGSDFLGYNGSQWLSFTSGGASSTINGSGSAGQLTYWNGTNSITGTSSLYWDQTNGFFGIGTSTPSYPLHIEQNTDYWAIAGVSNPNIGPSSTASFLAQTGDYGGYLMAASPNYNDYGLPNLAGYLVLMSGGPNVQANGLALAATGPTGNIILYAGGYGPPDASTERMRIESNGNVAIGTTSTYEKLTVNGAINIGATTTPTSTAGTIAWNGTDFLGYTGSQWLSLTATGTATGTGNIVGSGSSGQVTFWNGTSSIAGTSSFYWDNANGRLGIGTTTLTDELSVVSQNKNNDIRSEVDSDTPADRPSFRFYRKSSSGGQTPDNSRMGVISFNAVDSSGAQVTSAFMDSWITGSVNTTSGSYAYGDFRFFTSNGYSGATERLRINGEGLVGIGTPSPLAKLDVNGSMILSGSNRYLNFGTTAGSSGYGFRDNSGVMQFKNVTGTWQDFGVGSSSVSGSGSAGQVTFWSSTSTITSSNTLYWNSTNNSLSIGNSHATGNNRLQINLGSSIPSVSAVSSMFELDSEDGNVGDINIRLSTTGTGAYPALYFTRSRGTLASPEISQNNDILGENIFQGYFGTNFQKAASIRATVDGNPSTWAVPGKLTFFTAPDIATGTAPLERMTIRNTGNVGIGTSDPSGILHLSTEQSSGPQMYLDVYGTAGANIRQRRANGTKATPTALLSGDVIGNNSFSGYFGTAFSTSANAYMRAYAEENFSITNNGTSLRWATTPKGSISTVEGMTLSDVGYLGIGTSTPLSKLHVAEGDVRITSGTAAWTIGPGAFPNRTVNTDSIGLNFTNSSTWKMGLFTEVGSQLLSYGVNVTQIGNRNTSSLGAIIRLDTRATSPYWSIKRQPVGTTTEYSDLQISSVGDIGLGGHANDTNSFAGQVHILSRASSTIGLVVQGASGQTAALQQWQNNAGNIVGEAKNLSTNFGMSIEAGAMMSRNSYFGEEFMRERAQISADTAIAWGDDAIFNVDENGTCTWDTVDDAINGIGRQTMGALLLGGSCLAYSGSVTTGNAHTIFSANNLPVSMMKLFPSADSANDKLWVGIGDRATAQNGDPTNGIYFTNNTATGNWRGVTRRAGVSTNIECAAQTINNTVFALLKYEVVSSNGAGGGSVKFYVDNNSSDGINWTYCGESTTNIPTVNLAAMLMNYSTSNGVYLNVDYYRVWQDDAEDPGNTVLVLEEEPTSTVELTLDERMVALEGLTVSTTKDIVDIKTVLNAYGIVLDETASTSVALAESLNVLNLSLTETQSMLAEINSRMIVLETSASSTDSQLTSLQTALSDLEARLASMSTSSESILSGVYDGLAANMLVIENAAVFNGTLAVKKHTTFGEDTVGQAKILSGHSSTTITFAEPYETMPIITVTPLDYDGRWKLTGTGISGFRIEIPDIQMSDVVFNWQVFGALPESKVFVSDGTTTTIGLSILYIPPVVPEETPVVEEPVVETPPTEPVVEEPVVETPPAEEPPTEPIVG
ncbi:MAG: hypothetical protein NTW66_01070 [Candidatus Magasanikbacteria bacterium]|nr:hypothetical protein [Candidatus Magasanikbacteria bacterium]